VAYAGNDSIAGERPAGEPSAPALPGRAWAARYIGVILTALIGVLASIGAAMAVAHWDTELAAVDFENRARREEQALNVHLSHATDVLYTLKTYLETAEYPISAGAYEQFSTGLRNRLVGLRDTGWAPRVTRAERAAFERHMQENGFPGFQITERASNGRLVRAQERDEYFPIIYSDPSAPNTVVQGFDLGSERLRRTAIERAITSGMAAATPPLTLVNQNRHQKGFMSFVPVFERAAQAGTAKPKLLGVVLDVFETGQMIENVLADRMHLTGTNIYFFDPTRPFGSRLIYWHASGAAAEAAPSEAALLAGPHWIGSLDIDGQHWGAIFAPEHGLDAGIFTWNAGGTLAIGLVMTLMSAAYLLVSLRRAIRLEALTCRLRETTDNLRREGQRVNHLACHDVLTGLSNRLAFRQEAEHALQRARRGEGFALLYLDLDRFKDVNDTLGHPVGDLLLREVASRLSQEVRETDVVARLGGDEFAVIQSGVNQPAGAQILAGRLIDAVGQPYSIEDHSVIIGVSIGIALSDGASGTTDADTLMRNADLALYRAKEDGRGDLRFFDPDMDALAQGRRKLELDLRRALEEGEFDLHYQPLVSLSDRTVTGFEALLRWHHPTRGLVPPADFIGLAEEIGLIVPLGEWVLRTACAEAAGWDALVGNRDAPLVAVNVSAVQFLAGQLVETVQQALAASGLPPGRLELEVTESVLLRDGDRTLRTLHALRALGVRIAMDDFGTGYSSLSYLRNYPFDKIKIDQSFVRNLADGQESGAIIRAVAALGASLRITTLAEGVETSAQLEQLVTNGCTEVQGYFFSPPLPAHQIPGLLAELGQRWALAA